MSDTLPPSQEGIERGLDIVFDILYQDGPTENAMGWAEAAIACGIPRAKVEETVANALRAPPFLTKDMAIARMRHDAILAGPSSQVVARYQRYAIQRGATQREIDEALDFTRVS